MFAYVPESQEMSTASIELREWAQSYVKATASRYTVPDEITPALALYWLHKTYGGELEPAMNSTEPLSLIDKLKVEAWELIPKDEDEI